MIKKIWKDNFEILVKEGAGVIGKEDIDDVVDMLVADKIDPQVFVSNLEVLISGYMSPFNFSGVDKKEPSASVSYLNIARRAPGFPLWFYAAYPDVMKWFHEWQRELDNINDLATESAKLFGIDIEGDATQLDNIMNSEGKHRPKYLKNLVKNYKDKTNKSLEVRVDEFSEGDIYAGQEMLEAVGTESNFTLIAEITTKFYLELEKNYRECFADKTGLFATSGVLDAQWYVFSGQIKVAEIIDIAKKTIKSDDPLLNFIIELEINSNFLRTIDLTQLQHSSNLNYVTLDNNDLIEIDLSPLAECYQLVDLFLHNNRLKAIDLKPLAKLTNLRSIALASNKLVKLDLSPLINLNIVSLYLFDNQLREIDLQPLENNPKLEELYINENELMIIDLEPFRNINKLRILNLNSNYLTKIEDRKSTRLNSSHTDISRMPSSA